MPAAVGCGAPSDPSASTISPIWDIVGICGPLFIILHSSFKVGGLVALSFWSMIAVAVSGIAGPDGGTDDKPVGTVWFAWAVREGADARVDTQLEHFQGDRELVRELTVAHALQGLLERIA